MLLWRCVRSKGKHILDHHEISIIPIDLLWRPFIHMPLRGCSLDLITGQPRRQIITAALSSFIYGPIITTGFEPRDNGFRATPDRRNRATK